jgi:hypothetical protein
MCLCASLQELQPLKLDNKSQRGGRVNRRRRNRISFLDWLDASVTYRQLERQYSEREQFDNRKLFSNLLNNIVVVLSFENLCVLDIFGEIIREKQDFFVFSY